MSGNFTTIRIRQHGQILKTFAGCRFHRGGTVSGVVGNVVCFDEAIVGDPRDPRCGKRITPAYFDGAVTIEVIGPEGSVITRFGLATKEQVAEHPNCKATKYGR